MQLPFADSNRNSDEDRGHLCMLIVIKQVIDISNANNDKAEQTKIRRTEMMRHFPIVARQFNLEGKLMDQNPQANTTFGSPDDAEPSETIVPKRHQTALQQQEGQPNHENPPANKRSTVSPESPHPPASAARLPTEPSTEKKFIPPDPPPPLPPTTDESQRTAMISSPSNSKEKEDTISSLESASSTPSAENSTNSGASGTPSLFAALVKNNGRYQDASTTYQNPKTITSNQHDAKTSEENTFVFSPLIPNSSSATTSNPSSLPPPLFQISGEESSPDSSLPVCEGEVDNTKSTYSKTSSTKGLFQAAESPSQNQSHQIDVPKTSTTTAANSSSKDNDQKSLLKAVRTIDKVSSPKTSSNKNTPNAASSSSCPPPKQQQQPENKDRLCDFLAQFADVEVGKEALREVSLGRDYSTETQQITLEGLKWFTVNVRRIQDPVTSEPVIIYSGRDITKVMESARLEAEKQNMRRNEFCKYPYRAA